MSETNTAIKVMEMAERAFAQRDKLAKALRNLLDFVENASLYEIQHAADYSVYLDAKALLDAVGTPGDTQP